MSGYQIARRAVPRELIDDALRRLHLDIMQRGIAAEELSAWLWAMHWFPHLRFDDAITALAKALPARWQEGTRCEPQILLQFPHVGEEEPEVTFHTDQEPDWAEGRRYLRIVGVALTPWTAENGGLRVNTDQGIEQLELEPGDAVMMTPDLEHSGGVNKTGAIRYAIYFRYLEDDPVPF